MSREEWRRSRQGKKVADGRCGRTSEAQPVSDQTCHIEDVVAAPVLIKPDGFRRWLRASQNLDSVSANRRTLISQKSGQIDEVVLGSLVAIRGD